MISRKKISKLTIVVECLFLFDMKSRVVNLLLNCAIWEIMWIKSTRC